MTMKEIIKKFEVEKGKIEKQKEDLKYKYDAENKTLDEKIKDIDLRISTLNECICLQCMGYGYVKCCVGYVENEYQTIKYNKGTDIICPVCSGTGLNI